ncbi:nematocyst expressed protein 4-like isoform X2 [Maniola jurtina]|uniref:nematocyst expressed protein 4-like isoform X2 n=1 Tax=Maniola jurtina TaxID=191418 RepID=UPI001E68854E|nr:nematocyst expressed protein 4-like isoform X2 [Maniola jurtina]
MLWQIWLLCVAAAAAVYADDAPEDRSGFADASALALANAGSFTPNVFPYGPSPAPLPPQPVPVPPMPVPVPPNPWPVPPSPWPVPPNPEPIIPGQGCTNVGDLFYARTATDCYICGCFSSPYGEPYPKCAPCGNCGSKIFFRDDI